MRDWVTHPLPELDLQHPHVERALFSIQMALHQVRQEQPDWPFNEQLREARRRNTEHMLDALGVRRRRRSSNGK
jgi:hypothetical protein